MNAPDRDNRQDLDVVLTYAFDTLTDAAQRSFMRPPDRLAVHLAADRSVGRLLVADPARSWLGLLRRGSQAQPTIPGSLPDRWTLAPRRLGRGEPSHPSSARRATVGYDRALARAVDRLGMQRPALITCHPFVAAWAPAEWASTVLYYARDDWASHPSYAALRPAVVAAYERIRERGTRVAAVGPVLLEAVLGARADELGTVVHNGVDPTLWAAPGPEPAWSAALPRPLATYAGSLDGRLDVQAVRRLSESGEVDVALVGPVMDAAAVASVQDLPRVHLIGNRPHAEVAASLVASDVALLLHRETGLTRAMDPLKLYEYLAAGLPVVATDLPHLQGRGDRVHLVGVGADPVEAFRTALRQGRCDQQRRLELIDEMSWSRRFELIRALCVT